jgi:hypothetical protein
LRAAESPVYLRSGTRLVIRFEINWNGHYEKYLELLDDPLSEQPLVFIPDHPAPDDVGFDVPTDGNYYLRIRAATVTGRYKLQIRVES